jgi:hypothetical protein
MPIILATWEAEIGKIMVEDRMESELLVISTNN